MSGLAVTLLAIAVRWAWVLAVPTKPVGDFAMYLESAAHVAAQGALDPEFVYMPGYVLLAAAVQAVGGGLLAVKLIGATLGGLAAGAVYGIARGLYGASAALVAGLGCALWPGGIAVASVTGTDMPTAALVAGAVFFLVRGADAHPRRAAVAFGVVMGLAAWVRAVALPLAGFSFFYFWARGGGFVAAARRAALSVAVAAAMLAPWAARNHARYGEVFFTDSHGGLTALVGANPNTDGRYSRSLNRLFHEVTGYTLLAEPHREADRASYALAKDWTRFEPAYALGLVGVKLDRLLAHERPLLYWPVFRAGVLPEAERAFFERHRGAIETLVDVFYGALVIAAAIGLGVSAARREAGPWALVPIPVALVGIYGLFFAEVRYHLPIAVMAFPFAGGGVAWLADACARRRWPARELVGAAAGVAVVVGGALAVFAGGARLVDGHRWAAHVCHVEGRAAVCKWRAIDGGGGSSGVRGVWDGVGVRGDRARRVATDIDVPAGTYRVSGALEGGGVLLAGDREIARGPGLVAAVAQHRGGPLRLTLVVPPGAGAGWVWLGGIDVRRAPQAQ